MFSKALCLHFTDEDTEGREAGSHIRLGRDLRSLSSDCPISYSSGSQTAVRARIAGKAA